MENQPAPEPALQRVALELEYDGSPFWGWQRQSSPELPTIQARLEEALSSIAASPVSVFCAGRTDRGVHATGQVVHFETPVDRGEKAWVVGSNSLLPPSIRVRWARNVPADFHARFSALARRYLYLIYESRIASAHLTQLASRVPCELDVEAMHRAGQQLLGEHDFSAFRATGCESRTPWRTVQWLNVLRRHGFIVVDIQANAFLQHMVRNIVGMLLEVGRGLQAPGWAAELLAGQDRTAGAMTAPPRGLYLARVSYPADLQFPTGPPGPHFLQPYP
jgi:tRNA pseudouridine38-40 synthase